MLLRASPAPDSASNDPRLAKLHSSHPPARLPAIPDGQSAPIFCFLPRQTKTGAPTLKRFCPAGVNSVASAHRQRPLAPAGQGSVAQRTPSQAAGLCSWACRRLLPPPLHPNRNAARPPPARGAGARLHGAEGAESRHCQLFPLYHPAHQSLPLFHAYCRKAVCTRKNGLLTASKVRQKV